MNSLLMTLALTAGPTGVSQPPAPYPPGTPVPYPGRPAFYPPVPHHQRPMTLPEFAKCFQPVPGTHEVYIVHPVTCQPVRVCFTLPEGCGCPKVKTGRRWVEFDYGRREVDINFWRNGTVGVKYH